MPSLNQAEKNFAIRFKNFLSLVRIFYGPKSLKQIIKFTVLTATFVYKVKHNTNHFYEFYTQTFGLTCLRALNYGPTSFRGSPQLRSLRDK
ncbi:hypothetical protein BpHYR1_003205 [Brachionus plicatilis]|uniref:Uncharacterized protein n=1 Tax=Brachionus plicatilis TaxID=10195 RepID=A0A3M7SK96_BRAPC|nr:hypothetical protein BpHYR1_003205 [Brachionus plicatilis]